MSELSPNEVEQRQLGFACEWCGAAPGVWCRAVYLHSSRFYQATAAGLLPLQAGDEGSETDG